jgi:hypothetical protein
MAIGIGNQTTRKHGAVENSQGAQRTTSADKTFPNIGLGKAVAGRIRLVVKAHASAGFQ